MAAVKKAHFNKNIYSPDVYTTLMKNTFTQWEKDRTARAFKEDVVLLLGLARRHDTQYNAVDPSFDSDKKKISEFIAQFNKKYQGLKVKAEISNYQYRIRIFLNEKSLLDFYKNCAAKIPDLVALGSDTFKPVTLSSGIYPPELTDVGKQLTCYYRDMFEGSFTVKVNFIRENVLELKYLAEEIPNMGSPNFSVCAFYALRDKTDQTIDLKQLAETFSFDVEATGRTVGEFGRS